MSAPIQPAYIRDNPIMQGAFAAFIDWIWRQDGAHQQFTEETGERRPKPPANGLERMIDEATGHSDAYMGKFVEWAIKTQWGTEEDEDHD